MEHILALKVNNKVHYFDDLFVGKAYTREATFW